MEIRGFPILIAICGLLTLTDSTGIAGALILTGIIVIAAAATLLVSKLLAKLIDGEKMSFTLELPPFRMPRIGSVIVRSVLDRTLFVLGRAVVVAAPAGLVIWLLANLEVGDVTLLVRLCRLLEPVGALIGLDGAAICALLLGFPANEIVLPILVMIYSGSGMLSGDVGLAQLLAANGWTEISYVNLLILTVFRFPCSTTLLTIKKETGSFRLTLLSVLIPVVIGYTLCLIVTAFAALL
ncbi:MAG TPA: ferrous iron transporter B [Firmicutes bacterium]|nr:ferrous iron transporter B [Bacillota bacterium]